jgi:hypothetical protein
MRKTMTLVELLEARLAEDELIAGAVIEGTAWSTADAPTSTSTEPGPVQRSADIRARDLGHRHTRTFLLSQRGL